MSDTPMIDALRSASEKVTATIHEHREAGDGFATLCESLGVQPAALDLFVQEEAAKLNGNGTVEGALMHGALVGAVVANDTIVAAAGAATPLPTDGDLDWAVIGMLLPPHTLRTRILRYLHKHGESSPNVLATELNEPLGNVSYHVKALAGENTEKAVKDKPLVECVRTEPRRGAVEHFYRLTDVATGKRKEQ